MLSINPNYIFIRRWFTMCVQVDPIQQVTIYNKVLIYFFGIINVRCKVAHQWHTQTASVAQNMLTDFFGMQICNSSKISFDKNVISSVRMKWWVLLKLIAMKKFFFPAVLCNCCCCYCCCLLVMRSFQVFGRIQKGRNNIHGFINPKRTNRWFSLLL